jgi:hypothetical protein
MGDDRVSAVEMFSKNKDSPLAESASLGQIIDVFSPPDRVIVNSRRTVSFYIKGHLMFTHLHALPDEVNHKDPFESMYIYASPPDSYETAVTWQGFGQINRYQP